MIHAGWGPRGEGKCVFIKHPNGWMSLYLHMSTIDVEVGEIVKSRKRIGRVGSTGRSTGPHLHFQVQKNGRTVDPEQLLGKRSDRVKSP
ncbi:MAG: M23 family metallopeptidase [Myxococcota bacterium]